MSAQGILIAGGYGVVGHRIAADLACDFPDRVIVAGRNLQQAESAAAAIGSGARGRALDVTAPASVEASLDGVGTVVSCIDQPERHLLHAAIGRGLCYTDITPHLTELGRGSAFDEIDSAARASGARIVLGAGIVPGISNVMVRALAAGLGGAERIETALLLSAADAAGPASFDYFLQELSMPFVVHVEGEDRGAHAFDDPRPAEFPAPLGLRRAYLFPFSDQVLYPRTMGARTVVTRLALEPPAVGRLLALAVRTGLARFVARAPLRRIIAKRHKIRATSAGARFALRVDVVNRGRSAHGTLLGHAQADGAAAGAAGVVRALVRGEVREAGAWMPEQVIDSGSFLSYLATRGLHVELPEGLSSEAAIERALRV